MGKNLKNLWIIHESGTVIFTRLYNKDRDNQLFGGLLSAIDTFAKEVADSGITNFELSEEKYALMRSNNLLFVGNGENDLEVNVLRGTIRKISVTFFETYGSDLSKKWDGETNQFIDFEQKIQDLLKDPIEKFWEGF